jgi:pimeloyl-ACP methyl ester carboxylesterase
MTDERPTTPLQALDVIGTQEVDLAPGLRHLEIYTMTGLITVLWHGPPDLPFTVVACGGAMGGLLGPASGLYQRLGEQLPAIGIGVLRLSYRKPNDIDKCTLDLAAGVQLAIGHGATKVITMGHSFGGAIAVRVAVGLPDMVAGVVTFATQSAGCEIAGGIKPRPFLLFHGERDEILPVEASAVVREIADCGELVVLPNDGHVLDKSGPILEERLLEWLPAVFSSPSE